MTQPMDDLPLPEPYAIWETWGQNVDVFTAKQMREYGKKLVETDRALRPTSGEYAQGYAEGFNDACKPPNIETKLKEKNNEDRN